MDDGPILNNCLISSNEVTTLNSTAAYGNGGGVEIIYSGTLNNCTITENTVLTGEGGGVRFYPGGGTLNNCIVWNNPSGGNWSGTASWVNSCTTPAIGVNGIDASPRFVSASDYHLASNSPCINAGANGFVSVATDLDGHPRIVAHTVDMGAYEFGFLGCFITNSIPSAGGMALEWTAFPMWDATVKFSTNLVMMPFTHLSTPIPYPANSYTDLVHGAASECFYRVEIHP